MLTLEMRSDLRKLLIKNEGYRPKIYSDDKGNPTIGVGRDLASKGLSADEISYLLNNDVDDCYAEVSQTDWFKDLNEPRQVVILDMVFNLGWKGFEQFGTFIQFLREKDWMGAVADLSKTKLAQEEPNRTHNTVAVILSGELQ